MPSFRWDDHKISNEFGAYVASSKPSALNSCSGYVWVARKKATMAAVA